MSRSVEKSDVLGRATRIIVQENLDLSSWSQQPSKARSFDGPDFVNQEKIKEIGRSLQEGRNLHDRLTGYVLEAYGHFIRSAEAAANHSRKHPDFHEYIQHWFYSSPEHLETDAGRVFYGWFEKPTVLKIRRGRTFWKYRSDREVGR